MIKKKLNKTLDTQHNVKMREFQNHQNSIAQQTEQLQVMKAQLDTLSEQGLSNLCEADFQFFLSLTEQQRELEVSLHALKNNLPEVDYFLETADIIFKYYDIVENGNVMDTENAALITENSILRFFSNSEKSTEESDAVFPLKEKDRASLLEKYMQHTDNNYIKCVSSDDVDKCPSCGSGNRTLLVNDGLMYCTKCYSIETIIVDHEKPSYKDPPKEISYFSYKRLNHLNEWISQIQGKETTEIPDEVYDRIMLEIKKQRITNMADITPAKIKAVLKALKMNKFYEHVPHIINRLSGAATPNFTPEIEEKLRQMFKMIQIPFFNHAPKSRKNFLSYSYTIHKLLQLLELDQYLKFFPLLRSREKTFQMDQIWKKICADLDWQFVASI
jgi:hypothetical protein